MLAFLLLLLVPAGQCIVPSLGKCSDIRGVEYFDKQAYLGVWYEYANVFETFQVSQKCIRATYLDIGDKVGVHNEGLNKITGGYEGINGTAEIADPEDPLAHGELIVRFPSVPIDFQQPNYIVVDTDYTSYTIIWTCRDIQIAKLESLWLLTREKVPDQALVEWAYSRMTELGLPVGWMEVTSQENCDDLPAPPTK